MSIPATTPEKLYSHLLLEEADLRDIVEEFVNGLAQRIGELKRAYEALDWTQLQMLAHRLKGAAGSYGYPDLSRVSAALEADFTLHRADSFDTCLRELECLTRAAQEGLREP